MNSALTPFEKEALLKFVEGKPDLEKILLSQLESVEIVGREFTGVGFFTTLKISNHETKFPVKPNLNLVLANIEGLEHEAHLILFLENGLIHTLECAIVDKAFPKEIKNFKVFTANHIQVNKTE